MASRYEMLRVLGNGSFGQAWLAQQKGFENAEKNVVIKKIQIDALSGKDLDQALTEVAVLARCRHTNIVRYNEAYVDNGLLHVVMEYAAGGDLRQRLEKQHGVHLSNQVILDWFVQISFALQYIHSRNILHRDLKSQNIFLTVDGIVKLGDFGISRVLKDKNDLAMTAIGTPYYLSPEICQKQPYNHKSDIWSLGCVLYEMCALQVPFDAPNFVLLATKITQGEYKPIPGHFGSILHDLVKILLEVMPENRPSAEQILCIPAIMPVVKSYAHRQKSLVRSKRHAVGNASPASNRKCAKTGASSPGSPVPMQLSPTPQGSPNQSRKNTVHVNTPSSKRGKGCVNGIPGTPDTPSGDAAKRSKVNSLRQGKKTPPGSAEIRKENLKKLEGATPKLSQLVCRQRAAHSAKCYKSGDMAQGAEPKLSLFQELSKKRALSVDTGELINSATYKVMDSVLPSLPKCILSRAGDQL